MRMPSHSTLCSFIFSAIVTSAFVPSNGDVALASTGAPAAQMAVQSALNGLRAQGFAAGADVSLPNPAATPSAAPAATAPGATASTQGPILTPELMAKMIRLIALQGKDSVFPAIYANALGLSATGQDWPYHQLPYDVSDGFIHGFAYSKGSDQDILVYIFRPDSIDAFRAHRDGSSVTAIFVDRKTNIITMRAPAEAQNQLNVELTMWATNVDRLLGGK